MKQRLLVMNGQKLIQSEHAGQWGTDKVEKAGAIKPGIYNLYLSTPADPAKVHHGVVIHADQQFVYQQVGRAFVRHDIARFSQAPALGTHVSIRYHNQQAVSTVSSAKVDRPLKR